MTEVLDKEMEMPLSTGEEDLRQFLWELQEYPRLTVEEERELARRCSQGDEDAVAWMVSSNLRLVVAIAKAYAGRGVPLRDLVQEGSIGLLVAARKFDYTRDLRFSTYATDWIRKWVSQCVLDHSGPIRVPVHTAERMKKIEQARAALIQETGQEPEVSQIAQRTGLPEEKVQELRQLQPEVSSLDLPAGEHEDGSIYDLLEDEQLSQPYAGLVRQELETAVHQILNQLNERQRLVLQLHYGLEDGNCYSLEEIGKRLGISKERARQIEHQAIDKLQKYGTSLGMEDFLNE